MPVTVGDVAGRLNEHLAAEHGVEVDKLRKPVSPHKAGKIVRDELGLGTKRQGGTCRVVYDPARWPVLRHRYIPPPEDDQREDANSEDQDHSGGDHGGDAGGAPFQSPASPDTPKSCPKSCLQDAGRQGVTDQQDLQDLQQDLPQDNDQDIEGDGGQWGDA